MPTYWTEAEDRLTVESYFEMLASELKGEAYNKSAIRRSVLPHLNNRSHGSLELRQMPNGSVLEFCYRQCLKATWTRLKLSNNILMFPNPQLPTTVIEPQRFGTL